MNNTKTILIDSSVWISYYRPKENLQLKDKVSESINNDIVATCGLIKIEVLQGTTNEKDFDIVKKDFDAFHQIEVGNNCFERAAKIAFNLKRNGITIPVIDLIIATIALENNLALWHLDNHFELIKKEIDLETLTTPSL